MKKKQETITLRLSRWKKWLLVEKKRYGGRDTCQLGSNILWSTGCLVSEQSQQDLLILKSAMMVVNGIEY